MIVRVDGSAASSLRFESTVTDRWYRTNRIAKIPRHDVVTLYRVYLQLTTLRLSFG
jgi:hypothetical protein